MAMTAMTTTVQRVFTHNGVDFCLQLDTEYALFLPNLDELVIDTPMHILHNVKNAVRCCKTTTPTNGQTKIAWQRYAVRLRQHRTRLSGEFGASLATTRAQNRAAGTSAHTKTETVYLRAATVVRLKSSLAHSYISKAQLWQPGRIGRP